MCVVKSFLVPVAALLLAQPATATRLVQIEAVPAACSAGTPDCAPAADRAATDASAMSPGQIIAALAGMLVLGLVFGRRRPTLPQVVS